MVYKMTAEIYGTAPKADQPNLLDLVSQASRFNRSRMRTEGADATWMWRCIRGHHERHPASMRQPESHTPLLQMTVSARVAAFTQPQALSASVFLYEEVSNWNVDSL
jgi:hypothetical protein